MSHIIYVITELLSLFVGVLQFLMMVRAVLSWLPIDDSSTIVSFVYAITEPIVMPVRAVFSALGLFEGSPIDISFFVSFILLSLIKGFLL